MKYLSFILFIGILPCINYGMEQDTKNAILVSTRVNCKKDLNLNDLPDDMTNEIILKLIDWDALTIKKAKKDLLPLRLLNRRFKKLIDNILYNSEHILQLNSIIQSPDNTWRILQWVENTPSREKEQECIEFIKSHYGVSYAEYRQGPTVVYSSATHPDDITLEDELSSLFAMKDREFLQLVSRQYQNIAQSTLAQTRKDRMWLNHSKHGRKLCIRSWLMLGVLAVSASLYAFSKNIDY